MKNINLSKNYKNQEEMFMRKKELSLPLALLPIITVVFFALMSVMKWGAGMYLPIICSIIVAILIGIYLGFSYDELQKSLVEGVSRALPAFFILLIVGTIIGSWIVGGVIPALIYYSLKIISPSIFVPAAAAVTGIIAISTGTSFTSIATVGLALMVTGIGMGFPPPLLAGAIISGAYLGDSMSPLSDTTNLASAMAGCDLFELIGHIILTGIPAFLISIVMFYFVGIKHVESISISTEEIAFIYNGISQSFNINPLLLVFPIITIVFSIKKFPAVPSLITISILGGISALVLQKADFRLVLNAMTFGYKSNTGIQMIDSLLSRGGIVSMGNTIILMLLATALGGILEKVGFLNTILKSVMKFIKSDGQLILLTVLSGFAVAFATGAQLLAILLPARMFVPEFKARNLHLKNLARVAQSIGAIGINLVPWSVPCIFASNILGVEPSKFIPYLFFVFMTVIINLAYGFTGFTITKINKN